MGDLFPGTVFNVAAVVEAGRAIMGSPLGLIVIAVPVGFTVASWGVWLLMQALEERRFRKTPVGQAEWILYNNFVDHYTKTGGYKLDRDTKRWAKQMNLRKQQLGTIDARNTQRRVAAQKKAGGFISGYGLPAVRQPQRKSSGYSGRRNYGGYNRRRRYGGY